MSHLVYITLFGEADGVTISRLDCSLVYVSQPNYQIQNRLATFEVGGLDVRQLGCVNNIQTNL